MLMVERALRILPALNNVLSHHDTPIDTNDVRALKVIASVLKPFKNAIVALCSQKATLLLADSVLTLLLDDLQKSGTEFADCLRRNLVREIKKRRTVLSTALAVLNDPHYNFGLETALGLRKPSDSEIVDVLAEISDLDTSIEHECHARPKVRPRVRNRNRVFCTSSHESVRLSPIIMFLAGGSDMGDIVLRFCSNGSVRS